LRMLSHLNIQQFRQDTVGSLERVLAQEVGS
jgi:hypothetical protein